MRLEYRIAQEEFNETLVAATSLQRKVGKPQHTSFWAWLALTVVSVAALAMAGYTARDAWRHTRLDCRAIAEGAETPAPWVILFVLFYLPAAAGRLGIRAARVLYLAWIIIGLVTLAFIAYWHSHQSMLFYLPWLFLLSFATGYGKFFFRTSAKSKAWEQAIHLHGVCVFESSDERFAIDYPLLRMEQDWRAVHSWTETGHTFMLWVLGNSYHIVPKSAFENANQLQEFREMLAYATTTRKAAFPVIPLASTAASDQQ